MKVNYNDLPIDSEEDFEPYRKARKEVKSEERKLKKKAAKKAPAKKAVKKAAPFRHTARSSVQALCPIFYLRVLHEPLHPHHRAAVALACASRWHLADHPGADTRAHARA